MGILSQSWERIHMAVLIYYKGEPEVYAIERSFTLECVNFHFKKPELQPDVCTTNQPVFASRRYMIHPKTMHRYF